MKAFSTISFESIFHKQMCVTAEVHGELVTKSYQHQEMTFFSTATFNKEENIVIVCVVYIINEN